MYYMIEGSSDGLRIYYAELALETLGLSWQAVLLLIIICVLTDSFEFEVL